MSRVFFLPYLSNPLTTFFPTHLYSQLQRLHTLPHTPKQHFSKSPEETELFTQLARQRGHKKMQKPKKPNYPPHLPDVEPPPGIDNPQLLELYRTFDAEDTKLLKQVADLQKNFAIPQDFQQHYQFLQNHLSQLTEAEETEQREQMIRTSQNSETVRLLIQQLQKNESELDDEQRLFLRTLNEEGLTPEEEAAIEAHEDFIRLRQRIENENSMTFSDMVNSLIGIKRLKAEKEIEKRMQEELIAQTVDHDFDDYCDYENIQFEMGEKDIDEAFREQILMEFRKKTDKDPNLKKKKAEQELQYQRQLYHEQLQHRQKEQQRQQQLQQLQLHHQREQQQQQQQQQQEKQPLTPEQERKIALQKEMIQEQIRLQKQRRK